MAIVVEVISRSGTVVSTHTFDQNKVSIGRGYDAQVILHDPHVSPHHITIVRDSETGALTCVDMRSLNGTFLVDANKKGVLHRQRQKVLSSSRFYSGQIIQLGRAFVRIYDSEHHVAETLPLSPWEDMAHKLDHWWLWASLSAMLIVLQVWDSYLTLPLAEKLSQNFLKACYPLLGAIIYAGIFAFLGKNYKHDPKLGSHFSVAVAVILALSLIAYWGPYFSYWFAILEMRGIVSDVLTMALIFGGGYVSLALATPLQRSARIVAASVIPAAILIGVLIRLLAQPDFKPYADYDLNLVEPSMQWNKPISADEFVAKSDKLFDDLQIQN